jgi:Beta-propeller repeat
VDARGDLVLNMSSGEVRLHKPGVYQTTTDNVVVSDSDKQFVSGRFVVKNNNGRREVAFAIGPYDTTRPLVIDPQLSYSTYLGGNGSDQGTSIAVDSAGNAYVTGFTGSTNFPVTAGAFQTTPIAVGVISAFVTKLNSTGTALVYSTYLGGSMAGYGVLE